MAPTISAPSPPKPQKRDARLDDLPRFEEIIERPVFNAGRSPDPKPSPATGDAAGVSAPPAIGDLSKVRLTGIVSHSSGALAFLLKSDGQPAVLSLGDNIDGWTIKSINTLGVHLEGQGQTSTLRLPSAENRAQNNPQASAPQR